jgi:excisionase family DNA binding protein
MKPIKKNQRAFSIAQAAEVLGFHRASIYRKVYRGEIKTLSSFGRLTIPLSELERYTNDTEVYTPCSRNRKYASQTLAQRRAAQDT